MSCFAQLRLVIVPVCLLAAGACDSRRAVAEDWASSVALPEGETAVRLLNGKDLSGWRERDDDYFFVRDGVLMAANKEAVPASTYLFTNSEHLNFRLLLEVKQTMGEQYSTMHSAVAAVGEVVANSDHDPHGFRGPLLMFCHDWGIWGADCGGRVSPPGYKGPVTRPPYEKVGQWNQIEFLVVGDRVRVVSNGTLVTDHVLSDPRRKPRKSPLGLQLHQNNRPQEWRFRGLLLVDEPTDQLLTLNE